MADEDDGHLVNHAAFTNLIRTVFQEGMFKDVFDIAKKMPQGKNVNEAFACGGIINSRCRYRRHHGASSIVYIMRKRGCVSSLVSYNSIIHGLAKNGGYLRAHQLLEQGIDIGYHNCGSWKRSMMIALNAKNKIKIVNGDFEEPTINADTRALWEKTNDMIISWILNTSA
ncbi:pentatricopeptide repeat-containing protein [Tanacetum coccineum]